MKSTVLSKLMHHQDETELLAQINSGQTDNYAVLVKRYERLVFTLALRMLKNREEAEEISQDVFVKAFRSLSTFKGNSKFSSWLYRITYNACLDLLSRKRKHSSYDSIENIHEGKANHAESVLDTMEKTAQQQLLKACIAQLGAEEAFLITIYYYEEQSVADIASITNLTESNVKVKLFRSRKKLAKLLRAEPAFNKSELL